MELEKVEIVSKLPSMNARNTNQTMTFKTYKAVNYKELRVMDELIMFTPKKDEPKKEKGLKRVSAILKSKPEASKKSKPA